MASNQESARAQYAARLAQAQAAGMALDRRAAHLANLRLVSFLGFAVLLGLVVFDRLPKPWTLIAGLCLAAFIALAAVHSRVLAAEARAKELARLNQRGLTRLEGGWHQFPQHGGAYVPAGHLYAADLDVLGQGSLFQRLDETGTMGGAQQLARWLLASASEVRLPGDQLRERQRAVQELALRLDLRQQLVTEAHLAADSRLDPSKFIDWAEGPNLLARVAWAWPLAHLLPPVTLAVGVATAVDAAPTAVFWGLVLAQAAIAAASYRPLSRLYDAVAVGERGVVRFEDTFRAIAEASFESETLKALQQGLVLGGPSVPTRLARLSRLSSFAALRQSGLMHPIFNVLLLWDVHVLFRLERWRRTDGAGVRAWFDALAQFEALSSLATLPFEHPTWVFPNVEHGPFRLEASALGHPLLAAPVRNDVRFPGPGHAWVITGSNMSGKTTLLRAVGLNVVMAQAGLPVCAEGLSLSSVAVVTSMRVKDSLERGVSYFYAEVQRIKAVLDTARANPRACLFLLDELFMGTNTRERQVASLQLLRRLLDGGAAGALTTHDLSLCALAEERPNTVRNVHFRDAIVEGEMTFDYRLHPGIVQTSNALEVLRRAGVPLDAEPL